MKLLTFGKITLTAITLTILLNGCSGVDKERLAELTVGKDISQIKQSYVVAEFNGDEDKIEVYEYWLKENGNPTFDFDLYQMKVGKDVEKTLDNYHKEKAQIQKSFEKEMKRIEDGKPLNYRAVRMLKSKLTMLYLSQNLNYVKEYIEFLQKIKHELITAESKRKEK